MVEMRNEVKEDDEFGKPSLGEESGAQRLHERLMMLELNDQQGDSADTGTTSGSVQMMGVQPLNGAELCTVLLPLTSISSMIDEPITGRELALGENAGRVLYGTFVMHPMTSEWVDDIMTALSDPNREAIRVLTAKVLWQQTTPMERILASHFPLGRKVAIKNPSIVSCKDGTPAVRVSSPEQLYSVGGNFHTSGCSSVGSSDPIITEEELEKTRLEGNRYFAEHNWAASVYKYSRCIDQIVRKLEADALFAPNTTSSTSSPNFKNALTLAYSNRAEALLRIGHFEDALRDANKALEMAPTNVKTLVRKGKAEHSLGLFENSCRAFKAALLEYPRNQAILKSLKASIVALKQSNTGRYDLADYILGGPWSSSSRVFPPCADFVGSVEIRRVDYSRGRRGLFATRSVRASELLFAVNPLAVVYHKEERPGVEFEEHNHKAAWRALFADLDHQLASSTRQRAQFMTLSTLGCQEMDVPSMKLFKPGSQYVPPGAEMLAVGTSHIRDIMKANTQTSPAKTYIEGEMASGIWLLPSFVNHSCTANCQVSFIGPMQFLRAKEDIAAGEELTITYCEGVLEDEAKRQAQLQHFSCKCERCLLEQTLVVPLQQIRWAVMTAKPAVNLRNLNEDEVSRRLSNLSKIADRVDALIQSLEGSLGPRQQSWIRVPFWLCYIAKLELQRERGECTIALLGFILESITLIQVTPAALKLAARLLLDVQQLNDREFYQDSLDRILLFFRIVYGNLPQYALMKLIGYFLNNF